ncbi:MAG: FtsW/RodA/SpoVE family cell cycle protein, partial [Armatimonadota bacterium]
LFFGFTYRAFIIAQKSKSSYGSLLAIGCMSMISVQAIINISVTCNILPSTGLTLPYISYGGTSLITSLILAGLLLSVSRHVDIDLEGNKNNENYVDRRGNGGAYISGNKYRSSYKRNATRSGHPVRR